MHLAQVHRLLIVMVAHGWFCTASRAELRVAAPAIDLGVVRGGHKLERRFQLMNDGAELIQITDLERGCGCLAPSLGKRTLLPREQTVLAVELRTLGQADGPHAWKLMVRYRAGSEMKVLALSLRGTVQNDVLVRPAILGLHVSKVVEQEVTVTDSRAKPLRVLDVDVRLPGVQVSKVERLGNITKILITARAAELAPGQHEGKLTITTDDAEYDQMHIPIVVTKAAPSPVTVSPEQVVLRVSQGSGASAVARLRSTNGQSVRIAKIETGDPALVCTWAAGPGEDATMRIQVQGERLPKVSGTILQVHLAGASGDVVRIPVTVELGNER